MSVWDDSASIEDEQIWQVEKGKSSSNIEEAWSCHDTDEEDDGDDEINNTNEPD